MTLQSELGSLLHGRLLPAAHNYVGHDADFPLQSPPAGGPIAAHSPSEALLVCAPIVSGPAPISSPHACVVKPARRLIAGAAGVVLAALLAYPAAAGTLSAVGPAGASPGITVNISGTGFDTTAANNTVTFTPAAGAPVSVPGRSLITLNSTTGMRRLSVIVPAGLPVGPAALAVTDTVTGEVSTGMSMQVIAISLPDVRAAAPGAAGLVVAIQGTPNVAFAAGATRASFGAGITVTALTVDSPTLVHATISVASTAALGTRTVATFTSSQTAMLLSGFSVASAAPANKAPVVAAGPNQTITLPAGAGLAGSATDDGLPAGAPLTTSWTQVSGPGTAAFADAANQTTTATFDAAGTYVLRLTATDTALSSSADTTITVNPAPNQPPVGATAGSSYSGTAGQPVSFAGSATDPDNDPLTFTWGFGDGATATGASATHIYQTAGTFTVTLTVDDGKGGVVTATAQVQVAAALLGRGMITGRVFGDVDGLPIQDATVTLVSVDSNAGPFDQPAAQTDALGRFRLSCPPGLASLTISKDGWTRVERLVQVADSRRVNPLDVRLTPLDAKAVTVTSVLGNVVTNTAGDVRLTIGPGALTSDATLRLTRVSGQGLAAMLPAGWSPVGTIDLSPSGIAFGTGAPFVLPAPSNLAPGAAVLLARWDSASHSWLAVGPATRSADGASLQATISQTGQYVFALADPGPDGPPSPAPGQALAAANPATSDATVTIAPSPKIVFASPSAHSRVSVLVTPTASMTSGNTLDLDVSETYALSGGTLFLTPTPRTLALYRFVPAGAASDPLAPLVSRTVATPSRSFTAFKLQGGTIDLAARLPQDALAPYGALIPAAGGQFTAPTGEQIVLPADAGAGDVPVALSPVAPADLPAILPAGLTLVGGVAVDLHGATLTKPATLSIPLPSNLNSGAQVLVARITEIGGVTKPELVALARVQGGALVTTPDPFGDGSLLLPGIEREGWYLFLQPGQPVGFVTGVATAPDGSPLSGALVSEGAIGLVAVADANGHYAIAGQPGATTFTTTNTTTGDRVSFTAQVNASAVVGQGVSVGQTALTIASVAPSNGSTGVPLTSAVRVTFSNLLDPATIAGSVTLTTNGAPVAGSLALNADGVSLVFRPGTLLASKSSYQVAIGGSLRDTNGRSLAAAALVQFTTIDLTPPPPPPAGAITATIPGANGVSIVSGSQGTIDPDGVVLVTNVRTGAITTLTPNADGSFSGSVGALVSDRLQITLRSANGVTTPVSVPPFADPDGSVVVGADGGHIDGPAGTFADIPAGALPDGTIVKVDAATAADFQLAAPDTMQLVGGIKVDLGGVTARKEIHVGVQAPSTATAADQVLVVQELQLPLRRAWTVIDRAHLAGDRYVSESPPFAGVVDGGTYGMLKTDPNGCISYVAVHISYSLQVLSTVEGIPFFYLVGHDQLLPMPAVCNSQVKVTLLDPNTEAAIREATYQTSAVKDDIVTESDVITDDLTAPTVVSFSNPTGGTADSLQVVFSKAMNDDTVKQNFIVNDSKGNHVGGTIEIDASSTIVTFRPTLPFLLGEHYSVVLFGITDEAGNVLDAQPITFTPFTPQSLNLFQSVKPIDTALKKCTAGVCTSAVSDLATIGRTLFIANGLRTTSEQYADPSNPVGLMAVDVTDPANPTIIGTTANVLNPRALAVVDHASFTAQPAGVPFNGDLLLVESGGRTIAGLLPTEINVLDVTACTARPVTVSNCLANAFRGFKALSTAENTPPLLGVPPEPGEPLQIAALHQRSVPPGSDTVIAYATVAGIGLEAVDVTTTFNATTPSPNRAPDGLVRGDYVDVAVLKNQVAAVGRDVQTNSPRLTMFTGQLGHLLDIPPPPPPGLSALNGAARVAVAENVIFDIDGDGNVGAAEDQDQDSTKAVDELFDLALVSSGPRYSDCPGAPPCGELYVVDLSSQTDLAHPGGVRILDTIPLPGSPFSVQIDPVARRAYVEIRGKGLAVVDLSYLLGILRGTPGPGGFVDANDDGLDDRVLSIISTGGGQNDILMTRVKVDTGRGIAFVTGASTGIEIVQIANKATELSLDFGYEPPAARGDLEQEKTLLKSVIDQAVARIRQSYTGPLYVLEQGSGSCFWRTDEPLGDACETFRPGTSDHDLEFFVAQSVVPQIQSIVDDFLEGPNAPPELSKFGDLSMFVMPVEPLQNVELLTGTPLYRTGDTSGDLGMGRQTLLLLWILEGQWVPGYEGPGLAGLLANLKQKPATDPIFPCSAADLAAGLCESTGIPRLEGYEWARLQEYNFYKTGALLRVQGGCDSANPLNADVRDIEALAPDNTSDKNFNSRTFLGTGCQDTIHGVAKAAIRAVLARVVADPTANPLVLDIDPDNGGDDLGAYRRNACFDFGAPPFNLGTTTRHGCGSFEEYIATVATEASRNTATPLFDQAQLLSIVRFWCAKTDCDSTSPQKIVSSDSDADSFITEAFAFIKSVETATLPVYMDTIARDTKPIGAVPYLDQGPIPKPGDPASPGIAQICGDALKNAPPDPIGQIFAQHPELVTFNIDTNTPRADLRLCNVVIVDHKVNGDPNASAGPPLTFFQVDGSTFSKTKKQLGVKHYAVKALQVRARNAGLQTASPDLTLYEGDGVDPQKYTAAKTVTVTLDAATRREIAEEPDPTRPGKNRPLFPVLFGLDRPEIAPGNTRALAFVIDPGGKIPESDKSDNQAGFFYYVLDPSGGVTPASAGTPTQATDTTADPLAIPQSVLSFTFRLRSDSGTAYYGGKDLLLSTYSQAYLVYELANIGAKTLRNIQIIRQVGDRMRVVTTIPELRPKGQTGSTATFTDPEPFTTTLPGIYTLQAMARGTDSAGNTVGPEHAVVYVTASDKLELFDVKLFDASPLADADHPFTRISTDTNSQGQPVPLRGAVTDGDDHEGGGRIRIKIDRLDPSKDATVVLADAELPNVTDGVGSLTTDANPTAHVLQATVTPDGTGHAELYYYPPPVFVREAHRADDFKKKERLAQVTVFQANVGSTTRAIVLRRPPVFLVHGLFGTRDQVDLLRAGWDNFQPLVPPSGLSTDASFPVAGFDGRFDVFAVGEPFPTASFAKLAPELRLDIKGALTDYLSDFAIGKIDVVAHSMGALLISKLAHEDPRIAAAIRKLITLDSPFAGSALAKKLVDIRETNPIKDIDLKQDAVDPLNPPDDFLTSSPPAVKVKVKVDWCATAVRAIGLTPAFYLKGALDDLQPGSSELTPLLDPVVPNHRIALETNTLTTLSISPSLSINGMWAALGLLCGITPDASTVEWTQNLNNAKEIISTLVSMKGSLEKQGAKRLKGLLKVLKTTLKLGEKDLTSTGPAPVFASANDRIVESASQLGSIPPDDPAATTVAGNVDHSSVNSTAAIPISACLAGNDFLDPPVKPDLNGDGVPDVVCHVMRLLEADPTASAPAPRLFKP
ncbi:MAG: PKD domain-containing protein [Betaproteobacteria bacterium]